MLLIDEMMQDLRLGQTGLCIVSHIGASYQGKCDGIDGAALMARRIGRVLHPGIRATAEFVMHRREANGTSVVARFDTKGQKIG